jgi:hypothetical protein
MQFTISSIEKQCAWQLRGLLLVVGYFLSQKGKGMLNSLKKII